MNMADMPIRYSALHSVLQLTVSACAGILARTCIVCVLELYCTLQQPASSRPPVPGERRAEDVGIRCLLLAGGQK